MSVGATAAEPSATSHATSLARTGVIDGYSLRLRGIRFEAHIGTTIEERGRLQELVVDVDLSLSVQDLPANDDVVRIVDYDRVVRRVVEDGASHGYRLLESYALQVVRRLLSGFPARSVRFALTKAKVPTRYPVQSATVQIVGHRSPADESVPRANGWRRRSRTR